MVEGKRIAFLIGDITKRAGTERAVTNLANAMAEQKDKTIYIISMYSKKGQAPSYEVNEDIRVLHLNLHGNSKLEWMKIYSKYIRESNKIIEKYHLTHLIGTTHAINSLITFMHGRVKKIGCEHMSYAACPKSSQVIRRITYNKLDAVVLLTNMDAKHYSFVKNNKVFVIPNISSFDCVNPARLKNHRTISIGRLTKQKGFDLLVSAISLIKDQVGDWEFNIYGDGEDKEWLLSLIADNALQDVVHILPPVKNIKDKYLESSLYIMSSRWEGLPMVLIEAQSCGLPIVSFNCPEGPADIVHNGKDGILIEKENVEGLSRGILSLINDDNTRRLMGRNAKENASYYSKNNILLKWNKIL